MGKVTFLGVEGSGKTVLATSLVRAFKAHEDEGWNLRPNSREAFRFQMQSPAVLENGGFPHQTTALKHLSWSVQWNGETLRSLDILDYPGEIFRLAFLDAEDDLDPAGFRERVAANKEEINALLSHLVDSDLVFVLFNLTDAEDLTSNQDNLDAVWITNACLDYLERLPHRPSVSLLLTQIDRYVDLANYDINGDVYVAHHLPLIHRNHPSLDVLTVSAIGDPAANHGVDNIIRRCLSGCLDSVVGDEELKNCSNAVEAFFGMQNFDFVSYAKTGALNDAVKRSCGKRVVRPWFFASRTLRAEEVAMSGKVLADASKILSVLEWTGDEINANVSQNRLRKVEPASAKGAEYRQNMLAKLARMQQAQSANDRSLLICIIVMFAFILLIGFIAAIAK